MRRKKRVKKQEELIIKNNYESDIKIIKKLIKDLNIGEKRLSGLPITFELLEQNLTKLGLEFETFNISELVDNRINHQFMIVKLYDGEEIKKILIDLDFITFYPYSDINELNVSWIGDNLLSSIDGIEILNKIIIDGFILIDNNILKTYLESFSPKRNIDINIADILNNKQKQYYDGIK